MKHILLDSAVNELLFQQNLFAKYIDEILTDKSFDKETQEIIDEMKAIFNDCIEMVKHGFEDHLEHVEI